MALDAATTPLIISATQGAANAFVQGSVLTGLSGRNAYNVKAIAFDITPIITIGDIWAAVSVLEMTVSRRSKVAIPTLADVDVIHRFTLVSDINTSGAVITPMTFYFYPQIEVPIVEDTVYLQLDTNGIASAVTGIVRLEVELDTMSDIDRLNLIARSLT